jgi:hypothetical protein
MERQLGQLVRLVDDLLDISRITHNRIELRKTRVELACGDRAGSRGLAAARREDRATGSRSRCRGRAST